MSSATVFFNILIIIVFIVAIAFIVMSVRKQHTTTRIAFNGTKGGPTVEYKSADIRSRTIKCFRCGRRAYGILGTKDIYRCQSCGYNTRKENTGAPPNNFAERSSI